MRWYCPQCSNFPEEVFEVFNGGVESYTWDKVAGEYDFNETVESGDFDRAECEHGHVLVERDLDTPDEE